MPCGHPQYRCLRAFWRSALSLPIHHRVDGPPALAKYMSKLNNLPTTLVVEPNFLIASVIEAPLLKAGYKVAIATDPDEAFALLDGREVRLALIDFRLGHAEPDGLVARLKQRAIPFIFYTAATTEEVCEHFPDARVISKPCSDDELLAAVASLVPAEGPYQEA